MPTKANHPGWGDPWEPARGDALDRLALLVGVRRRGWRWLPMWLRRWIESDEKLRRRTMDLMRATGREIVTVQARERIDAGDLVTVDGRRAAPRKEG